ncbi:MAG: hypothetical protein M3461_18110, partial [Pseudomonadota bacterium]|nr:hypothetical protein [Pseudomonadota bacterium]
MLELVRDGHRICVTPPIVDIGIPVLKLEEVVFVVKFWLECLNVQALVQNRVIEEVVGPVVLVDVAKAADLLPHVAPDAEERRVAQAKPLGAPQRAKGPSGVPRRVFDVLPIDARHVRMRFPYCCINIAYLGISGSLQGFEVMQQLLLDRRIGGHAEGELPLR